MKYKKYLWSLSTIMLDSGNMEHADYINRVNQIIGDTKRRHLSNLESDLGYAHMNKFYNLSMFMLRKTFPEPKEKI